MDETRVYIYLLRDPRTDSIRYVGSTKNPEVRLMRHWKIPCSEAMQEWIAELKKINKKPLMTIVDEVSSVDRQKAENAWATKLLSEGHPLLRGGPHQLINRECKNCGFRAYGAHDIWMCRKCWSTNNYYVIFGPQLKLFSYTY